VADQLGDQGFVVGNQQEVAIASDQLHPTVARDIVLDIHPHVVRDGVLAITPQPFQDRRSAQASRGRVPQRQGGDAMGMDVLGALFQLRKTCQHISRILVERIINLQEDTPVSLDNNGILWIVAHIYNLNAKPGQWQICGQLSGHLILF